MKLQVKVSLYVLITACAVFFGYRLYRAYNHRSDPAGAPATATQEPMGATNTMPAATNQATTAPKEAAGNLGEPLRPAGPWLAEMATWGALFFGALVGLGILIGWDLSHFTATQVEEFLFNEDGEGIRNPEYEEAEELWKRGQHLEAVQLMRDHYQRNPREVYVALRIAEIYEKDLNNAVAAALEYEEVLKRKLPPDRWGWAAIHLSNLYTGKLNKTPQALDLLQRIVVECGESPPAKKARERLEALQTEHPELVTLPRAPAPPAEPPPPGPKLPPGFRPLDR
jgi:hypothetical protein